MSIAARRAARRLFSCAGGGGRDLLDELKLRGLISQVSQPERLLHEKLADGQKLHLYCGADPTARSLHLGNIVPLMVMLNFYVRGHDVVALVGGATGRVGDPSGRKTERDVMEERTRIDNIARIKVQLSRFFRNGLEYYSSRRGKHKEVASGKLRVLDNYSWWKDVGMLDFLSRYGRHIRIQSMLARESVSARLDSAEGLGFNEFTYQILQAYDFYHMYREDGVSVQVGGNDQWGNITAGIDLISRADPGAARAPAFGVTTPLLTTASGEKFGKSAGNAVFIDPELNTNFDIFQFFYNTADADVARFLKMFTFLPSEEIDAAVSKHMQSPHLRKGQTLLAREVTDLLHGSGSGENAQALSDIVFGEFADYNSIACERLIEMFSQAKMLHHASTTASLTDLVAELSKTSKSGARRILKQGGVYLGPARTKVTEDTICWAPYLIDNRALLIRIGKQKCFLVKMA
ncbi:hypothetical protein HG536_0A06770 [Torulaspora globosa]|uniref:Tyrosine--tRNA ligase n=1 Tax=Torulaspora globosa TaxID=48254 RepID=A0A7G3ZBH6_9SACH|nr:uncharacterized protein HG536_0A06770 [Torulaspora globosa]QLL30862.1 hypothetical protein HG536_0A06770 [Torulaspora globosa]